MSSKLTFDIKDNDIKDVFDNNNNPFLINISGTVNICMTRCDQEIDNCGSIKINTMTNYGNILSLNTDTNVKCNVKLPYESEGDNKSYVFKKIVVTVPTLNRINDTIYDMEIFIVFASPQKDGTMLYLVLCTLLSGSDSIPSNGDPKLLTFKLLNELFSEKNTVPEKFGTSSINLTPNPVDLNTFIPSVGYRTFYSYNHPKNSHINIRVFDSILTVSNNVLSILKNKLTPGNSYQDMKNIIKSSINPDVVFYYNQDLTNNYASFESNKGIEYKKDDEKKDDKKKTEKNDDNIKANNTKANNKKEKFKANKIKEKNKKKKSKKEKFTNKTKDDIDDDIEDDDDDNDESIEDDDSIESLDDDSDDDDDESLSTNHKKSKKIEKYDSVSKTADHFVDTDNKNIVSVIIYLGFMLASILFLYVIISNLINNPTGKPIDKQYFMNMFNKSNDFKYSTLSKICFIILYIFCIFLGLIMLIYLLLFFYNPTKFLIQSSTTLLIVILIFTIIAFIFLGIYVYFRFKTNESSNSSDYSDCDKYTLKMFEWFSIKNIIDTIKNNPLTNIQYGGVGEENPLPGSKTLLNNMGNKLNSIKSTIESLNPLWVIIFMLFVPFIFILSCYLFPNYNNIYAGYVKDFVRSGGAMAVIYSIIYILIFLFSFIFTGVYINKNYVDIQNSNMIMMTLFIVTLIVLSSIFVSKMITFMKAFFIFLLVFLSIFLLFLGYICYKKYFDIAKVVNANIGNIEMKEMPNSSVEGSS